MKNTPTTYCGSLERQALEDPNSMALLAPGRQPLTWSGLFRQVTYVMEALNAIGLGRGDRIAIVLENGADLAVACLGVAAGAIAVPLNAAYRKEELESILGDSDIKAIVALANDARSLATANGLGVPLLALTPRSEAGVFILTGKVAATSCCTGFADADEQAFVLYTSGTTARPKGVKLTHANVWASAVQIGLTLGLSKDDRCLNIMPLHHIHGLVGTLLSSLIAGGGIVCTPGQATSRFIHWMQTFAPTWYSAVPAMHQQILTLAKDHREALASSSLRLIRSSSARLPPPVLAELEQTFEVPVIEAYGMTEAAHQIASNALPPADRKAGSVGRATGCEVAIADATGHFLAPGEVGEIIIRGDNVTSGYLGGEDHDAKFFLDDWLKTGDQGRLDSDGNIYITGRLKEMINRGGENISPLEIEDALLGIQDVVEAAVFPVPHPTLGEDTVAALVLRAGTRIQPDTIREWLFRSLADFKVPSRILLVDAIPKGPNGKLQRQSLATHFAEHLKSQPAAARNPCETALAEILSEVLGIEQPGVHDKFFSLGGDSLSAIHVTARINHRFGVTLSAAKILRNPTIDQLARIVANCTDTGGESSPSDSLAQNPIEAALSGEASFSQKRLWLLHELYPLESALNQPFAVKLRGNLDVPALVNSLRAIVMRHDVFRTRFELKEGRLLQRLVDPESLEIPAVDLRACEEPERTDRVRLLMDEAVRRPFDPGTETLFRALIIRTRMDEWILLFVVHHIAIDGWSRDILLDELSESYQKTLAGDPDSSPRRLTADHHHAEWQRQQILNGAWNDQLDYWRRQLADLPTLALPKDRPQRSQTVHRGDVHSWTLPAALAQSVGKLARDQEVTVFMVLMSVLQTLLHRYTGQDDIVVGIPISGRTQTGMEHLVGLFINTLALRADLSGDPPFRELLTRMREVALAAYANQDVPFEYVLQALRLGRDTGYSSALQVMLNVQSESWSELSLPGVTVSPMDVHNGAAKNELTLSIRITPDSMRGMIEYDSDLFEADTISRMAGHFQYLLEGVIRDPELKLSILPLMDDAEKTRLLGDWNANYTNFAADACIDQLLQAQVEQTPNRTALVSHDRRLTYSELDAHVNSLTGQLQSIGAKPGAIVGLFAERSIESVIGVLSILKAGCACLPLDPECPDQRLNFMIEDAAPRVLLVDPHLTRRLPSSCSSTLSLDLCHPGNVAPTDVVIDPGEVAYVIYTSGSSGQPKAVCIDHRHILNRLNWMWTVYPVEADDVACHKCAPAFLDSIWEIFGALLKGVPTVIISDPELKDLNTFVERLACLGVTRVIQIVPSLLRALLDTFPDLGRRLPGVKLWLTSGEELSVDLYRRFRATFPQATLCNIYGCSEATGIWYQPEGGEVPDARFPIGRAIPNTHAYILDHQLQPVPVGIPGELHISGLSVAHGYLNRPELTERKFIRHSFDGADEVRLYKTGDRARWRADGKIEYIGRMDNQLKLRGIRIEPGEIEAALCAHGAVSECVVIPHQSGNGDNHLVAYVVAGDSIPVPSELRASIKRSLPSYMVPSAIMVLDTMPLNPNGKIDRFALPTPQLEQRDPDNPPVAPRDEIEASLVRIWSDALEQGRVSIHDDLFELGANSLLAMQVLSHVRENLGVDLTLLDLLKRPTIFQLADYIRAIRHNGERPA